jgi:hypothetical protein
MESAIVRRHFEQKERSSDCLQEHGKYSTNLQNDGLNACSEIRRFNVHLLQLNLQSCLDFFRLWGWQSSRCSLRLDVVVAADRGVIFFAPLTTSWAFLRDLNLKFEF